MSTSRKKTHIARWIADAESELTREVTRSAAVTRVGLLSAAASSLYGPRDARPRQTLEQIEKISALKAAVKARRIAQLGKIASAVRTPQSTT